MPMRNKIHQHTVLKGPENFDNGFVVVKTGTSDDCDYIKIKSKFEKRNLNLDLTGFLTKRSILICFVGGLSCSVVSCVRLFEPI